MRIGRERVREGEKIGEGDRDKERLNMTRDRFMGQVEGEKDLREASRHWGRRGARTTITYAAEIGSRARTEERTGVCGSAHPSLPLPLCSLCLGHADLLSLP